MSAKVISSSPSVCPPEQFRTNTAPEEDVAMDEEDEQPEPKERKFIKSFISSQPEMEKLKHQVEQLTHQMESYIEGHKQNIIACPEQPSHTVQSVQQLQQILQPELSAPPAEGQTFPPPYPGPIPSPAGAEEHSTKTPSKK